MTTVSSHFRLVTDHAGGKSDPLQPRDRGGQAEPGHRTTGQDRAHSRGSVLLPPRPPPGADEDPHRRHEGRRHHRHGLRVLSRRRGVRLLRRGVALLHRRTADRHLRRADLPLPRRARLHQQAARRPEARAWHDAAALCRRGAPRQDRRGAHDGSGRAPAPPHRQAERRHRQLAAARHRGARGLHQQGGGGVALEGTLPEAALRAGARAGLLLLYHWRGPPHILE